MHLPWVDNDGLPVPAFTPSILDPLALVTDVVAYAATRLDLYVKGVSNVKAQEERFMAEAAMDLEEMLEELGSLAEGDEDDG